MAFIEKWEKAAPVWGLPFCAMLEKGLSEISVSDFVIHPIFKFPLWN